MRLINLSENASFLVENDAGLAGSYMSLPPVSASW